MRNYINFSIPEGGMTVWSTFNNKINLIELAYESKKRDLYFSDGTIHHHNFYKSNSTRLGFASSTLEELEESVFILKESINKIKRD